MSSHSNKLRLEQGVGFVDHFPSQLMHHDFKAHARVFLPTVYFDFNMEKVRYLFLSKAVNLFNIYIKRQFSFPLCATCYES